MKLLAGRLLLGCLLAVLVLADEEVKKPKPVPEESITTPKPDDVKVSESPTPVFMTKILGVNNHERKYSQTYDSYPDYDYEHHHHPRPPPHHHHYPPPSHHHHHPPPHYTPYPEYPSYYPPHYPYNYPPPPPPPYPYPPQNYVPSPMKPITIIHAPDVSSGSSSGSHKPADFLHQSTGYLLNLIDQKNNELLNHFNNKHNSGSDDNIPHDIVVINAKPGVYTGPPILESTSSSGSHNWFNKGKNFQATNCNDK